MNDIDTIIRGEDGEPVDPFFALLDDAWYYETKGELQYDDALAGAVLAMRAVAREYIDLVACEQYGADWAHVIDEVTEAELARRMAVAINVLLQGGR